MSSRLSFANSNYFTRDRSSMHADMDAVAQSGWFVQRDHLDKGRRWTERKKRLATRANALRTASLSAKAVAEDYCQRANRARAHGGATAAPVPALPQPLERP